MKSIIMYIPILTLVVACDAPQRTRTTVQASGTNTLANPTGTTTSTGTLTPSTTTSGAASGTTNTINSQTGFTNCDLTPKYYSAGIGYIGVCQSSADETQIALKPSLTDTSVRTCLIPTYKDSNGSSAYIGGPQCTYTTQNQMIQGQLPKNRSGFTTYTLNGVMIMKETSLTAYFKCMDAYSSYVSQACPYGAKTNASCDAYARNYMSQLCNDFKVSNSYLDIRLK